MVYIYKKGQNQRFALQELLRNSRWLPSTLRAFSYTLNKKKPYIKIFLDIRLL